MGGNHNRSSGGTGKGENMFVSYDVTKAAPAPTLQAQWGEEWPDYIAAVMDGFTSVFREVEDQLKAVCYRERLEPEIGFAFHITFQGTAVEIFFRIKELPRFLSLTLEPRLWLPLHFHLEGKDDLENDAEWRRVAEHRAQIAAKYLAADLARDGLPTEVKRCIVLIAQFSKMFYQSCAVLKWQEV